MSRLSDALQKARLSPAGDSFRDLEHPWGEDLDAEGDTGQPAAFNRLQAARGFEPSLLALNHSDAPAIAPMLNPRHGTVGGASRQHLGALVERVFLPVSGEPTRCVAFSGLEAPSGDVTAMVAEMLAQQTGASVCVVDANFAAPSLHKHFGVSLTPGLSDAIHAGVPLTGVAREVQPNLWLVPAGTPNRLHSFASDAVRLLMAQFIAGFEYVLADIAPATRVGDATGLAPLLGKVILVVAADATRRQSAQRAAQILRSGGAAVIGAVLTNRRFPIPEALYRRL